MNTQQRSKIISDLLSQSAQLREEYNYQVSLNSADQFDESFNVKPLLTSVVTKLKSVAPKAKAFWKAAYPGAAVSAGGKVIYDKTLGKGGVYDKLTQNIDPDSWKPKHMGYIGGKSGAMSMGSALGVAVGGNLAAKAAPAAGTVVDVIRHPLDSIGNAVSWAGKKIGVTESTELIREGGILDWAKQKLGYSEEPKKSNPTMSYLKKKHERIKASVQADNSDGKTAAPSLPPVKPPPVTSSGNDAGFVGPPAPPPSYASKDKGFSQAVSSAAQENKLSDPNKIQIGQKLKIGGKEITVQKGDTLSGLTKKYGGNNNSASNDFVGPPAPKSSGSLPPVKSAPVTPSSSGPKSSSDDPNWRNPLTGQTKASMEGKAPSGTDDPNWRNPLTGQTKASMSGPVASPSERKTGVKLPMDAGYQASGGPGVKLPFDK